MNDIELVAMGGCIVFAVIGIMAIYLLQTLKTKLEELHDVIPDKQLISALSSVQQNLSSVLSDEQKAIQNLPLLVSSTVSTQVNQGLEPLRNELSKSTQSSVSALLRLTDGLNHSHENFLQALSTVNNEGHFTEWITALRETVAPMEVAGGAIQNHYSTATSLLECNTRFVADWSVRWDEVADHLKKFNDHFEGWFTQERISRGQIEHRIMNRLEEVNDSNYLVKTSLAEMQSSGVKLLDSSRDLTDAVSALNSRLRELSIKHESLMSMQKDLLDGHAKVQSKLESFQVDLLKRSQSHQEQLGAFISKVETALSNTIIRFDKDIAKLSQNYGSQLQEVLHEITKQQSSQTAFVVSFQKNQREFSDAFQKNQHEILNSFQESQNKLLEDLQQSLAQVPSRKMQVLSLVFQAVIAMTLIGFVYAFLQR